MDEKELDKKIVDVMKMIGIAVGFIGGGIIVNAWASSRFEAEQVNSIVDTAAYFPLLLLATVMNPIYKLTSKKGLYILILIVTGVFINIFRWVLHFRGILPYPRNASQSGPIMGVELVLNVICAIFLLMYILRRQDQSK